MDYYRDPFPHALLSTREIVMPHTHAHSTPSPTPLRSLMKSSSARGLKDKLRGWCGNNFLVASRARKTGIQDLFLGIVYGRTTTWIHVSSDAQINDALEVAR